MVAAIDPACVQARVGSPLHIHVSVSYTHLDVYKRQLLGHTLSLITLKLELSRKLFERDPEGTPVEGFAILQHRAWRRNHCIGQPDRSGPQNAAPRLSHGHREIGSDMPQQLSLIHI